MEKDVSALKLTTASYWRPNGKNIHRFPDSKDNQDWGVKPNAGFEVPMKDEERLEYLVWRNDRDIVRTKKKDDKDKNGKEKAKDKKDLKDFKDRVMEKAVEHIKKEIEKTQAHRLLNVGNA
jgi:carboxyl-terminal processing protease